MYEYKNLTEVEIKSKDYETILQIIAWCEKLKQIPLERGDLQSDHNLLVLFKLFQVGEHIKHLSVLFNSPSTHPNWRTVIKSRDKIGHAIEGIPRIMIQKAIVIAITDCLPACLAIRANYDSVNNEQGKPNSENISMQKHDDTAKTNHFSKE